MIAMELDGRHVGKTIHYKFVHTLARHEGYRKGEVIDKTKRAETVQHMTNGDVRLSYYGEKRIPPDAEIIDIF